MLQWLRLSSLFTHITCSNLLWCDNHLCAHHNHHEKKRTVGEIPSQEFHGNSKCSIMIPVARNSLSNGLIIQPIPPSNPQPTWCQSYLSKPRILGLGNHTDDTITVWKYSSVCHDPIHVSFSNSSHHHPLSIV